MRIFNLSPKTSDLKVIDFKLNNSCYHCFKDFMEDMINMISKFRDYYGIHGMENKKEVNKFVFCLIKTF